MEFIESGRPSERGELRAIEPPDIKRSTSISNGSARNGTVAGGRHASTNGEAASAFSPMLVAHALRMRWPWIILLGVPLGAALSAAAFLYVPTPYTAFAELFCQPRKFFWATTEDNRTFEVYKQTTMRLIKDPFLLNAALQRDDVKNLSYVRDTPDVLATLSKDLKVTGPAQEFIRIELSGNKPAELAAVVNAITKAFETEVVDKEIADRKQRLTELEKLLSVEEDELRRKQGRMRELDKMLESPNAEQNNAKRQAQIDTQLALRSQIAQLQPQIIKLQILLGDPPVQAEGDGEELRKSEPYQVTTEEMQTALLADSQFAELARQYGHAMRMLAEWKRRVREPHPSIERYAAAVQETEARLDERRKELEPDILRDAQQKRITAVADPTHAGSREQLHSELQMLVALRNRYEAELNNVHVEEKKHAIDSVEREAVAQDVAKIKATVDAYATEVLKRSVELENAPPPIKVHQAATTPTVPDTKKRTMLTAAGAVGGVLLVMAAFVLWELHVRRVSDLSMVRASISTPVLGTVPLVPRAARTANGARNRVAAAYWRNVLSEAFDGFRTVLLHNPRCSGAKVLMVASGSVGEGKSTTCSQLAMSLARTGHRVLLIDGDLRRPTLEREFGLAKQGGFCEVLAGSLALRDAIRTTELPELDLLPAGTLTNQVRGLLARDAHADVFRELAQQYNFVVVDTSPVLLAADTLLLARHVDGAIVIAQKDVTQLPKLELTLHRFEMIGVPVLGLLAIGLNDASPSYSYGFGYAYGLSPSSSNGTEVPRELPSQIAAVSAP